MISVQEWVRRRQIAAEMIVLFLLVEQTGWISDDDLAADARIAPWRLVGALNRLALSKKVRVSLSETGGRMYVISEHGRDFILPAVPVPPE